MSYVEKYIHKYLGLTDDNKGFNVELINGRMKEIDDCVTHLERIRNKYACDVMQEWSKRLSVDYSECKKVEFVKPENIINTGVTIPYENVPDAIAIRIQFENGKLYYGLTCINANGEFIKGRDWLYYKYTSFKDGYEDLKKLIEITK